MKPVIYTIIIVVVVGVFLGFLATGWLVLSGLMIIPAIIVAFIAIFALLIV